MSSSSSRSSSSNHNPQQTADDLLVQLLKCVKDCQRKYGGKTELATEPDSCVVNLCRTLESVLLHGLRPKVLSEQDARNRSNRSTSSSAMKHVSDIVTTKILAHVTSTSFFPFVSCHLTKHERERFNILRHIWTDSGRGKAWIRSALNEKSLERYFHILLSDADLLVQYYEDWAILRNDEQNSMLPNMAGGLNSILFAISIDKAELNANQRLRLDGEEPIIEAPISINIKKKKKTKVAKQIISFDDDAVEADHEASSSSSVVTSSSASSGELSKFYRDRSLQTMEEQERNAAAAQQQSTLTNFTMESEVISVHSDASFSRDENITDDSINLERKHSQHSVLLSLESNVGELTPVSVERQTAAEGNSYGDSEVPIEDSTDISAVLTVVENRNQEVVDKLNENIVMLMQENKCLKDHLQRYISAVKLLKRDDAELPECLQGLQLLQNVDPNAQNHDDDRDYKHEAAQYEHKLVQIAEMHAELIDFNGMLQQTVLHKNGQLDQLRREVASLRGNDPQVANYDGDDNANHQVQIWIPSAFLTGTGSDAHHVYQIFLRVGNEEWNIYRRYSQFYAFHADLRKLDSAVTRFDFPPKKSIGKKKSHLVEERRKRLQSYLRKVIGHWPEIAECNSRYILEQQLHFFKDSTDPKDQQRRSVFAGRNANPSGYDHDRSSL